MMYYSYILQYMRRGNSVGVLGVAPYKLEQNINKVGRAVIIFIVGTLLCVSGLQP